MSGVQQSEAFVMAVDSGRRLGGPGAARTESLLGFYLTWGSSLHLLLADAVVAVALILQGAESA